MDKNSRVNSADLIVAKENLLGSSAVVNALHLNVSPYDRSLYIATTTQKSYSSFDNPSASFDPDAAQFDALMKAVATHAAFTRPKKSIVVKAARLCYPFLDPSRYIPLDPSRTAERFLKPFSNKRRLHWYLGVTYSGHPIYVPEDMIYRGDSRDCLYYPGDSGLAAHPDPLAAIKLATISRIKADACMRTWYKKLHPYVIDPKTLPEQVQSCIEYWRSEGRELIISQLDNDFGEIYLAIIRGVNFPCFTCGVGATLEGDSNAAMLEAIANAEADFGLLTSFNVEGCRISEIELQAPLDHALYYARFENREKTDFLTERKELSDRFKRPVFDFFALMKKLELTVVWLTPPKATYHVARVFSPRLVPISYGFGLEHSGHEALAHNSGNVSEEQRHAPHCFFRV